MGYRINQNYQVEEASFRRIEKNDDYNCLMIEMNIGGPYTTQGYPACRTKGGYQEQVDYLKEVFDVTNIEDLMNKNFLILSAPCDVFCLFNPENNKFFSLPAKFFPENYTDALKEIKDTLGYETSDKLDDFNLLMIGVIKSQKKQTEMIKHFDSVLGKANLYAKLSDDLSDKPKSKNKVKI